MWCVEYMGKYSKSMLGITISGMKWFVHKGIITITIEQSQNKNPTNFLLEFCIDCMMSLYTVLNCWLINKL